MEGFAPASGALVPAARRGGQARGSNSETGASTATAARRRDGHSAGRSRARGPARRPQRFRRNEMSAA